MSDWWCEHAWLGGDTVADGVTVSVDDGAIVAVRPDSPPTGTVLHGLVIPGLANAHSHAFHRALRSRTQRDRGSFWTWRTLMYAVAQRLTPDTYRALARAVYAEMALAGITAVGEFHYLHHDGAGRRYADPNAMGHALIDAATAAGLRLTLLDTCYLSSGIDGARLTAKGMGHSAPVYDDSGCTGPDEQLSQTCRLMTSKNRRVVFRIVKRGAPPPRPVGELSVPRSIWSDSLSPLPANASRPPASVKLCHAMHAESLSSGCSRGFVIDPAAAWSRAPCWRQAQTLGLTTLERQGCGVHSCTLCTTGIQLAW